MRRTIPVKLTQVEIDHILNLIHDSEREGSYYGPREQYWKRSARIRGKLKEAVMENE